MTIARRAPLAFSAAASNPALAAWPQAGRGMPLESAGTPHICLGPLPIPRSNWRAFGATPSWGAATCPDGQLPLGCRRSEAMTKSQRDGQAVSFR